LKQDKINERLKQNCFKFAKNLVEFERLMLDDSGKNAVFVLASARQDGTIAILCRSTGPNPGPAICSSKKAAIQLKTRLSNDPRGIANHRALELIKSLLVYKIDASIEPLWDEGSLWAYLPQDKAKCLEGMLNF
jgi:hypothetical protein